jgi:cell division protein FtsB
MKFRINLATQPYENPRRFFLLWGALLLAVALLSGALVFGAVGAWRSAHVTSQRIAAEQATLDKLKRQEQQDLAVLNQPANRDVKDRSQVLNALIHRKQFSWTLIFADLERLMPTRLHVVAIKPKVDDNNDIQIRMTVAGDSRDKAIELVHNMEQTAQFRHAQVISEANKTRESVGTQAGDTVLFEITAQYVPAPPAARQRSGE